MIQARFWGFGVRQYPSISICFWSDASKIKSRFASPAFKRAMGSHDLAILRRMTNPHKPDASRIKEPGIGTGDWVTDVVSARGSSILAPI